MLPDLASSIIRKSAVSALITLLGWVSRTASFTLIIKSAVGLIVLQIGLAEGGRCGLWILGTN